MTYIRYTLGFGAASRPWWRERNQMSKWGEQGSFRIGKPEDTGESYFKQDLGPVYPVWEVREDHGWGKEEWRFGARIRAVQCGFYCGDGEFLQDPLYNKSLLSRSGSSWLCLIPAPRSLCCWLAVGYQALGCAAQLFHILSKILVPLLFS